MIVAVAGGPHRFPSLAELDELACHLGPVAHTTLRHGDRGPTDKTIAGFVRARDLAGVEYWSGREACAMLDGAKGDDVFPPLRESADLLIALEGDRDTEGVVAAATQRGIPVVRIEQVSEPRPWNRHHGRPPGPSIYIGRNDKDPRKGSPLGNPFELKPEPGESRRQAAPRILGQYRRWLHARLVGPERDHEVIAALESITPDTFVVCSCWEKHCHATEVIYEWRWWREEGG